MAIISRRAFTRTMAASAGSLIAAPGREIERPNIILICSDQHAGRFLGGAGDPVVHTPNLDRLARMGVLFRNAYCNAPAGAPARAALMSGRFASDVGSYCSATVFDGAALSWTARLRDAGYRCYAAGKLDIAPGADWGFAEEEAAGYARTNEPDVAGLLRSPACVLPHAREEVDGFYTEDGHGDAKLIARAVRWLRERAPRTEPWAMYLCPRMPHPPWRVHRRYREMYPPEKLPVTGVAGRYLDERHTAFKIQASCHNFSVPIPEERARRARSAYFGMITELDRLVGQLLGELENTGQLARTLVTYTSDHGEMLGEHGLWSKGVLLEAAARVPMILAGAGLPRGAVIDVPVSHVDLAATLLDLSGAPASGLRGHPLAPLANGAAGGHPGFAFGESHADGNATGSFMIRKGRWKYIYFTGDEPLLFDLATDPGEYRNLAGSREHEPVRREMHAHLASLVDPDAVTHRAFAEQRRALGGLVARLSREEFERVAASRLGTPQARTVAERFYRI